MTIPTTPPINSTEEIRQLKPMIEEVAKGLMGQQELLMMRGMALPPGALQGLSGVQTELNKLEQGVSTSERELNQLRALIATAALVNSSLDLDTVMNGAMDQIINLTGAERGYIILKNETTGELEFRVTRDFEQDLIATPMPNATPQVSTTILNEVLTTGQALLTDNAYKDPRMAGGMSIAQFTLRSVLCVPLKYKDRIIGAVYVDNRFKTAVFTARELTLLTAFANQVAVAIENARLYSDLQLTLAEITEMKDLIENVFASIGSGVITTDAADHVISFNNAAKQILNCAVDSIIGQPLDAVLPTISSNFDEHLRAVREANQSTTIEANPDLPGRGRVVLNLKLSPLKDATQNTQGVAMVVDDLTETREREQVLNLVRRYLPPGMMDNIHEISQLALGGERREVTCLFADVCPLAIFPPDLRPQQLMEMMNVYLTRATDAVHRFNGLVDKYNGSEIMVLFNTQLNPQEDHAIQAVMAALELRKELMSLYEAMGRGDGQSYYRIGVHSGVATLGNVGSAKRRNFTAIGDTINLSKRLEENARPGQIIVSEDTLRYIEKAGCLPPYVKLVERATLQVKGRQQQTAVFEVMGGS
jgi:PAS domain S-box-containing protein